jgi:RNA polymerase sigma-70 factor, ECF subfamily
MNLKPFSFLSLFLPRRLNHAPVAPSDYPHDAQKHTQHSVTNAASKTNTTASDDTILSLIRGGDRTFEQGFRLLMSGYRERLYWHIRRIVLTHDDTDDVLQNTFVKVYRAIGQFEGKSQLYTWLYRIATNEALSHLQSSTRHASISIDDTGQFLANQLRADAWFDGDELQLRLQEAAAQLPEKQRIVFNLRYFDEVPYEQMSQMLDTSVGALKASFHHAVKKIEAAFEKGL